MPENLKILTTNEIISFFETNYSIEKQKEIVKILFRLEHTIQPSQLLNDLLEKQVICVSKTPYISYRIGKYFDEKNIQKISERKNFIFSIIPNVEGLKRGKSASYDDLVDFIEKKYSDLFSEVLKDIKVYSFSEAYKVNGRAALLYLNRKLDPRANYKFNSRSGQYELKDDEITDILRQHNIKFEVDKPELLFSSAIKVNTSSCQLPLWKVVLLIILWPLGLYYLISKKNRSTNG